MTVLDNLSSLENADNVIYITSNIEGKIEEVSGPLRSILGFKADQSIIGFDCFNRNNNTNNDMYSISYKAGDTYTRQHQSINENKVTFVCVLCVELKNGFLFMEKPVQSASSFPVNRGNNSTHSSINSSPNKFQSTSSQKSWINGRSAGNTPSYVDTRADDHNTSTLIVSGDKDSLVASKLMTQTQLQHVNVSLVNPNAIAAESPSHTSSSDKIERYNNVLLNQLNTEIADPLLGIDTTAQEIIETLDAVINTSLASISTPSASNAFTLSTRDNFFGVTFGGNKNSMSSMTQQQINQLATHKDDLNNAKAELDYIIRCAKYIGTVISNQIDLKKLQLGTPMELQFSTLYLKKDIITPIVKMIFSQKSDNIYPNIAVDEALQVTSDALRLSQIIQSLLATASRATHTGSVTVSARLLDCAYPEAVSAITCKNKATYMTTIENALIKYMNPSAATPASRTLVNSDYTLTHYTGTGTGSSGWTGGGGTQDPVPYRDPETVLNLQDSTKMNANLNNRISQRKGSNTTSVSTAATAASTYSTKNGIAAVTSLMYPSQGVNTASAQQLAPNVKQILHLHIEATAEYIHLYRLEDTRPASSVGGAAGKSSPGKAHSVSSPSGKETIKRLDSSAKRMPSSMFTSVSNGSAKGYFSSTSVNGSGKKQSNQPTVDQLVNPAQYPWLEFPRLLVRHMNGEMSVSFGGNALGTNGSSKGYSNYGSGKSFESSMPGLEVDIFIPIIQDTINASSAAGQPTAPRPAKKEIAIPAIQVAAVAAVENSSRRASPRGNGSLRIAGSNLNGPIGSASAASSGNTGGGAHSSEDSTSLSSLRLRENSQATLHEPSAHVTLSGKEILRENDRNLKNSMEAYVSSTSHKSEVTNYLSRKSGRFLLGLDENSEIAKALKMVQNLRILIIEGNQVTVKMRIRMLQACLRGNSRTKLSSNVVVATTCEEALEICEKEHGQFDVVLVSQRVANGTPSAPSNQPGGGAGAAGGGGNSPAAAASGGGGGVASAQSADDEEQKADVLKMGYDLVKKLRNGEGTRDKMSSAIIIGCISKETTEIPKEQERFMSNGCDLVWTEPFQSTDMLVMDIAQCRKKYIGSAANLPGNKKLLLVDDSPIIIKKLTKNLKKVLPCSWRIDGKNGLESIMSKLLGKTAYYDIIIANESFPGNNRITGSEFFKQMRGVGHQGLLIGFSAGDNEGKHRDSGADMAWSKTNPPSNDLIISYFLKEDHLVRISAPRPIELYLRRIEKYYDAMAEASITAATDFNKAYDQFKDINKAKVEGLLKYTTLKEKEVLKRKQARLKEQEARQHHNAAASHGESAAAAEPHDAASSAASSRTVLVVSTPTRDRQQPPNLPPPAATVAAHKLVTSGLSLDPPSNRSNDSIRLSPSSRANSAPILSASNTPNKAAITAAAAAAGNSVGIAETHFNKILHSALSASDISDSPISSNVNPLSKKALREKGSSRVKLQDEKDFVFVKFQPNHPADCINKPDKPASEKSTSDKEAESKWNEGYSYAISDYLKGYGKSSGDEGSKPKKETFPGLKRRGGGRRKVADEDDEDGDY